MLNKKTKQIIKQALEEDIGKGDITTSLAIPASLRARGVIIAKEGGVLCGVSLARYIFKQVDQRIIFKSFKKDGDIFKKGDKIAVIRGKAKSILTAERVVLNFLSLLSGISTVTRKFVDKVSNTKTKVMDTRKTTPNLRDLEKYAVRIGGGRNHRSSLSEGIMVKDNHLRAGGYVTEGKLNKDKIGALIVHLRKQTSLKIEIEVENLEEFKEVIKHKPDIILLDNFSLKNLKTAIGKRNKHFPGVKLEASGGIKLSNVRDFSCSGIDFISVGMMTHSPQAIDFSLEIL